MRSQREVRVISAQLELLEERKAQAENYAAEINPVIDLCQAWMEEREESPTSFRDLLKLCVKMADMCPDDVDCQSSKSVPVTEMKRNTEASLSLETSDTARKHEENSMEKLLSRLSILETTVSFLSLSHKVNEDNILKVKKTVDNATRNMNERLQENEQKGEQARKEQSEQMKDLHDKVKGQTKKVQAFTKLLQEMEEQNKEHYDEHMHDISTCNDAITLLQSKYSDLATVTNRCKELDRDVVSLKSSLQSLSTSCGLFRSSTESVEQKQKIQIEQLQTKVQTLKQQTSSSTVLLLKHQNTLRNVVQSCVKKQEANLETIEHLKSEEKLLSPQPAPTKPPIGFLASYFLSPEETIFRLLEDAHSYESSELNERHKRNTQLVLTCFKNIFYSSESDYTPSTGIFKVRHDGLYLVYADICDYSENTKHIYIGLLIRRKEKIADFAKYVTFPVVNQTAKVMTILHLRKEQEICILKDENSRDSAPLGDFACILLV